jgi:hypothetical protein
MLKTLWYRTGALLSTLLALLLILPCGYPVWATETLTLEIPLLSPIKYTSKTTSPTTEESASAQADLRNISQTAYDAFLMDHPLKSMWIDIRNSRISVTSTSTKGSGNLYHWEIKTLYNQIVAREEFRDPKGMTERLQRVVEGFSPSGSTLYEKVLSIHDYVCASTVYDLKGSYVYSAYGALVDKRSVCEGYAEAFKLLCDQNGIPCVLVSGTGITSKGEENHMWNYVRMDDGKWYAVDATWDDDNEILRNYFLIGSDTVVNTRSGKRFGENHKPNGDISRTGLKTFAYPTLSVNAYTVNNPTVEAAMADTDANNRWFYDQLNAEQKNFYDHLLTLKPPKGEDLPEDTTEEPTTTTKESPVTTPTVTTPSVTTPDDTTKPPVTTPDTTTNPPVTTPNDTTPEPPVTTPDTTEPTPGTTKPTVTTPPVTTEPSTTVTDPITTDPVTTETTPKTETDGTDELSDSTVTTNLPTTVDTDGTETTDQDGQTLTDGMTVSLDGRPESTPDTTPVSGGSRVSVGYILRVIVIVLALLALFALIALTVIRFDQKQS